MYGLRFTVVADHKPPIKLYSPSWLEAPTCIHRWSLKLQEFDSKSEYEPGMNNIADILSRKPFFDKPKVNEAEHFVNYITSNFITKTLKFHPIQHFNVGSTLFQCCGSTLK